MNPASPAIAAMASKLQAATNSVGAIPQLSITESLTLADAYAVQLAGVDMRRRLGEDLVGLKLGFTSKEKARQMGVSDVILGVLTSAMAVPDEGEVDFDALIDPRVEPEIAFRLAPDAGELPLDDPSLLSSITHVAAALEVIDSRYRNFEFSLEDVVADNGSASRFVVGAWQDFGNLRADLDLSTLSVEMRIAGETAATGNTGAILGNPLNAIHEALRLARCYGHPVPSGSVILAGAATPAVSLPAQATVTASVEGLGEVSLTTA